MRAEIRKLDGAKISGYEDYKAKKMTREAFLERKEALDASKQELSAAVSELEAQEIVEEAGKREYREAFRIQEYNLSGGIRDGMKKELLEALPVTIFAIHGNHEQRPQTIGRRP